MKEHQNLSELLDDFIKTAVVYDKIKIKSISSSFIQGYVSSNILATSTTTT